MSKWDIEDTGYTLEELEERMRDSFINQGLPVNRKNISMEVMGAPGCIRCEYSHRDLHYQFTINLGNFVSYDASIKVVPRGKGYGRRLEKAREKFCRELGIESIELTQILRGSEEFWKKMGYKNGRKKL
jgi:hypothetical protein